MTRRISGQSFDTTLMGTMVHIEKASLSITDNSAVAQTRGIPDGYVDGDVAAELEFEIDAKNFTLLGDAAKRAGSWRGMKPDDVLFYADTGDETMKVEAFGVKLLLSDLLDVDPKGGSKGVHKVKGFVTSPDFVHINGVPYLSDDDTRHLKG
ncbi:MULTISPECIES: phage protein [Aeromonas]|uniref:Phage protein n=1 Tax=Aeromonas molluscorum 848 TaxID=1268236 RepID=R1GZ48_9GAMM|nr:phage protein [Aeromonas molluscorum]EOD56750.1 phage protein [Aeromonas molluscorum 848]